MIIGSKKYATEPITLDVVVGIDIFNILLMFDLFGIKSLSLIFLSFINSINVMVDIVSLIIFTSTRPLTAVITLLFNKLGINIIIKINLVICSIIKENI